MQPTQPDEISAGRSRRPWRRRLVLGVLALVVLVLLLAALAPWLVSKRSWSPREANSRR